ncbi:hypothetical protein M5K25_009527 [Dendrobium thyrsiflorum]|uniref:PUM-HD domain-containing protein n=1 Tax=Dendrobium thyrsiflorum TaxID=117978 RepID=A0ABD0VD12_DENTH
MVTGGSVKMATVNLAEDLEEDFERDIEAMLREQQQQQSGASFDRERELNIYRSGSAPPTVEGSRNAIRSMFDGQNNGDVLLEEEMRSHPAYMSYYYLNENLNPRLPPPLLSKEDWRAAKMFDFGGIGDRGGRKQLVDGDGSSRSLFSMQPGLSEPAEHNGGGDWLSEGSNGLTGLTDIGLGSRRKSFTDALQDDFNLSATVPCHIPRPFSQNTFENASSSFVLPDVQQTQLCNGIDSVDNFCSRRTPPGLVRVQSLGSSLSRSFASAVDPSLARSRTPGPQLNGRSSSPCLPSVGSRVFDADTKMLSSGFGRISSEVTDYGDMEAALASLSLSKNRDAALAFCSEYVSRPGTQPGSEFLGELVDPSYVPYLQSTSSPAPISGNLNDPSVGKGFLGTSDVDLLGYQKAYLEKILEQQKLQYGGLSKVGGLNNGLYGPAAFGVGMPYPLTPVSGAILSSMGPGNHLRQSGRLSRFPTMLRSTIGASKGSWDHENGIMEEEFASTLLAEFKNNKTRSFELSDIVDHVVEFSADQYGSRFIQQKLEMATVEEKNKIFPEILPHARALMTDVFGNYVIQKFFEHGTESQRNQLASRLLGHVLPLSLQMYGCRVIQKALEVVDVKQQTQLVSELDGSVMKCVRDQNGNHVIQKCIECVPQESIKFIISACYGQVVALSTHPYGCRVIQRILEHCDDAKTQCIMMNEILQSICTLAKDQYGNYVVQHVLQHGKSEERSSIISKLSGEIVKMSQQKFASNVIEKCLTYSSPEERQLLINEMLGSTEENEPLQAMMKDQFGNYVVQKVLETCDDRNRELILSRIKVHLNTLKRYTYGKHIVARVEKLIAAGERRIGMASSY